VAGILEKMHYDIIWRQNYFKIAPRWTPALGNGSGRFLATLQTWLSLNDFVNPERI